MRDARINRIVEGTTDVMHLFLAREALDGHMQNAKPLFSRSSTGEKIKTLFKCAAVYPVWFLKTLSPSFLRPFSGFHPKLKKYLRAADRRSKRLARAFFFRMARFGPGLADRQLTLARIVDIGTELAVMGLVASRIQTDLNKGKKDGFLQAQYWLHSATIRIDNMFAELSTNSDAQAVKLATALMEEAEDLPIVDTSHLKPMAREYGSDLCSGKATERLNHEAIDEDKKDSDSVAAK